MHKETSNESPRTWWQRLLGMSGAVTSRKHSPDKTETADDPAAICQHTRYQRAVGRLMRRILRKPQRHGLFKQICPICGRLPFGAGKVEYILTIWFIDGDSFEYRFRARNYESCYEVTRSALRVFLKDSVVYYPLTMIGTIEFTARELSPDSPEVQAAQAILHRRNRPEKN